MMEEKKSQECFLFGTAGAPLSAPGGGTPGGVRRVRELGLDCMEVQFVRGVKMGEEAARAVREAAEEGGVKLSCHAPYYVNLNSDDGEKAEASIQRIFDSARVGAVCGVTDVVFHPGFYVGEEPEKAYTAVRKRLEQALTRMRKAKIKGVTLRPELTGKPSQIGSMEEILRLSRDLRGVLPCVDFSHYYARHAGERNSYDDFAGILEKIGEALGDAALKSMHIHLSGIEYGPKGEKRHLEAKESGINYRDVLKALVDFGAEGRIICESPNLEDDALLFQKAYRRIV
ncbi:MAG: TIM barrel protein [bacterium]